jgi:hypothetical protein
MHSPSLLTPLLANQVISDHAEAARANRVSRSQGSGRFARLRARRPGASRILVPRGRTSPPFAR